MPILKLAAGRRFRANPACYITTGERTAKMPELNRIPQVAIDFRWLDQLSLGNGQFRYAVDLISGLAELAPEIKFVVLGSKPQPIVEIAQVFSHLEKWRYESFPRLTGKGSLYREQALYLRLLRKLDIDLLHALHTFVPIYPPVPVIETVYDMMPELFPEYAGNVQSREYRLHKWAFLRFASGAIAISKTTANDLERLWRFPAERIDVVYLGSKLPGSDNDAVREGAPMILAPYNLEPRKNLSRLLQAVAKLKEKQVPLELVLFGRAAVDESREQQFHSVVSQLNLDSCIKLTGRVSDQELANLYRKAAVFAFPSLYEGFGLPVLEAMSAGAAIVAHHESAMAEVLGDAGYLVDMNDVSAICDAVERALKDGKIGQKAVLRAQVFSRERMARETLAVYRKTLKITEI